MGAAAPAPLSGASNFRDLGGLPTRDGRRLRHGALFRSDALSSLSGDDLDRLAALGLRHVCDLRSEAERQRHPNRLPSRAATTQHGIGFLPAGGHDMLAGLGPRSSAEHIHAVLEDYYRRFAAEHVDSFARLFAILVQDDATPLLLHCTSGKDRTGFGVALILSALDVLPEAIRADYLRSNERPRDLRQLVPEDTHPEALRALMQVEVRYLDAGFAAIRAGWGDIDGYLAGPIGLGAAARARLRGRLLVPA